MTRNITRALKLILLKRSPLTEWFFKHLWDFFGMPCLLDDAFGMPLGCLWDAFGMPLLCHALFWDDLYGGLTWGMPHLVTPLFGTPHLETPLLETPHLGRCLNKFHWSKIFLGFKEVDLFRYQKLQN